MYYAFHGNWINGLSAIKGYSIYYNIILQYTYILAHASICYINLTDSYIHPIVDVDPVCQLQQTIKLMAVVNMYRGGDKTG